MCFLIDDSKQTHIKKTNMNRFQIFVGQVLLWTTIHVYQGWKFVKLVWHHPQTQNLCRCAQNGIKQLYPIAFFLRKWFRTIVNSSPPPPPNVIIAICGKKGSGKDTCAQFIRNSMWRLNGDVYKHRTFAKPLKDVVQLLTNCSDDMLHTHEGKESVFKNEFYPELNETYRDILKSVGKSVRRFFLHWIDRQWRRETELWTKCRLPNLWVLSDLRLFDELQWLKNISKHVRVYIIRIESPRDSKTDTDITETSVDQFPAEDVHFKIYNTHWDDNKQNLKRECERISVCISNKN